MRPLHHPTPRLLPRPPLDRLGLLPPRADVGREPKLLDDLAHLVEVIPLIQAQPLRRVGRGLGPAGVVRDALQGGAGQPHVVALGPLLGSIRGVFPRLFPPRGAPWSCTRPSTARTSQCLSSRRRPSGPPPTSSGRRRPSPTLGSGRGPWSRGKISWRPGPSIGSRCGERRGWPPCRPGRPCGAGRRRSGGCWGVGATGRRWPPIGRREGATLPGRVDCPRLGLQIKPSKQVQLHAAVIVQEWLFG